MYMQKCIIFLHFEIDDHFHLPACLLAVTWLWSTVELYTQITQRQQSVVYKQISQLVGSQCVVFWPVTHS